MANYSSLSHDEAVDKVWELVERIGVCMLVTWDGERQRARPVSARPDRDGNAIHFLVDEAGAKDDQIRAFPIVSLAFADIESSNYLAMTGEAEVSNDREKIAELFSPTDRAWWDSKDDPSIRLVTVRPQDAEIWGGLGRPQSGATILTAAISPADPHRGDNRKIDNLQAAQPHP